MVYRYHKHDEPEAISKLFSHLASLIRPSSVMLYNSFSKKGFFWQ
jgi:hypothetical protein